MQILLKIIPYGVLPVRFRQRGMVGRPVNKNESQEVKAP